MQRVAERQPLVEIAHQLDVGAERLAHDRDRPDVVVQPFAPEPQLDRAKATLGRERFGFLGEAFERRQPEPAAVVGGHRRQRAAEIDRERQVRRLGERVPGGHVEARDGDHRDALQADQAERGAALSKVVERGDRLALACRREVVKRWHDVAHRVLQIGRQIAVADDPFLGVQIDQDQRPLLVEADA